MRSVGEREANKVQREEVTRAADQSSGSEGLMNAGYIPLSFFLFSGTKMRASANELVAHFTLKENLTLLCRKMTQVYPVLSLPLITQVTKSITIYHFGSGAQPKEAAAACCTPPQQWYPA